MPGSRQTDTGFPPLGPARKDVNSIPSSSNGNSIPNTQDLEQRLRDMIVGNQSKLTSQKSNGELEPTKQQHQALPPHMRTREQQDEHLRNKSNARGKGSRGSLQRGPGPTHTDRRKQQRQMSPSGQQSAETTQSYANDSQMQAYPLLQSLASPTIPPHLRGSSPDSQEEHLYKKGEPNNTSNPDSTLPRKRLNQAERRKQQKQHGQLGILNQPSSEPALSDSRASSHQAPSLPVNDATFTHHPRHKPQEAPRFMQSSVAPSLNHGFRPLPFSPPTSQYANGADRTLRQAPTPSTSHQPYIGPDQLVGREDSSQSNRRFQRGFNHHRGSHFQHANQQHIHYSEGYGRPPPRQQRLYDPRQQSNFNPHMRNQGSRLHILPPAEQIIYLDTLARYEIPKATMDASDIAAKDNMRQILEKLCREAVVKYEQQKSEGFDAAKVKLECFGSLSSGFATVGSDMDLALVSPDSAPSTASPESEIPRLLEKVLLDNGYGARLLTRTRVPIIKFCESPTVELREALIQERAKWEKSLLEPPKAEKKKKSLGPGKGSVGVEVEEEKDKSDSGKKRKKRKLGWMKVNEVKVGVTDTATQNGHSENLALAPEFLDVPGKLSAEGEGNGEMEMEATSESKESDDDAFAGSGSDDNTAEQESEEALVGGAVETETFDEKDEEKLHQPPSKYKAIMRSAEELIRLYRLAIQEDWYEREEREIIFRFISVFEWRPQGPDRLELHKAREALKDLPDVLSRYRDKPDDTLEFPKTGLGVQCDINFSNTLALHNTALLRCYSLCDPRIQQMVIFVKAWAKRRKINNPYRGTLSSYGYVLMVLHYVVNVAGPPLAPNLQRHPYAHDPVVQGAHPSEVDGYDVRFWRDEPVIREAACQRILLNYCNEESLGSLLRGFFCYYAQQGHYAPNGGFCWAQDALSLRSDGGLLTKKEKDWTGAKRTVIKATAPGQVDREIRHRYLFAIEDPFEIDHNIARTVVHEGIVAIRDEFRRAHHIIQKGGMGQNGNPVNLFEEGKELPSQRTYFGPKPWPFIGPMNLAKELRPKDPYGTESQEGTEAEKLTEVKKGKTSARRASKKGELGEKNGGTASKGEQSSESESESKASRATEVSSRLPSDSPKAQVEEK